MKLVACDTETRDLTAQYDPECPLWMAGFQWADDEHVCHDDPVKIGQQVSLLLADGYDFVFVNASFDVAVLRLRGIDIPPGRYHDIALMHYLLEPSEGQNHSLNTMAQLHLGEHKLEIDGFHEPSDAMREYMMMDVRLTYRLIDPVMSRILEDEDLWLYYLDIALPYTEVLIDMVQTGAYVDKGKLQIAHEEWRNVLDDVTRRFWAEAGYRKGSVRTFKKVVPFSGGRMTSYDELTGSYSHCELNWFSPTSIPDVTKVLQKYPDFEPLKLSPKTRLPVLDKQTLPIYAEEYEAAAILMEHRKVHKFFTAFLHPILERVEESPIIHCSFHDKNTRTTRKSCSSPNFQQVPSDKERGASLRDMFEPRHDGNVMVVGDLDRIEVCVFAFYLEYMFGYTGLSDAVRQGIDVHQRNCDAWHCDRKAAKIGIFLTIYGGGAGKLSQATGLPLNEAKRVLKRMYDDLPIERYRDACFREVRKNRGYMRGLFGDRYFIPECLSDNKNVQASGQRKAGNYRIQGTAGSVFDILQVESLDVVRALGGHQILAVHDEAVYEFPRHTAEEAAAFLTSEWTRDDLLELDGIMVPVKAEFHVGKSWHEAKGD
jgi:DNA polymerase I-like protein with 3'-5' exonuclease and polymerase domains